MPTRQLVRCFIGGGTSWNDTTSGTTHQLLGWDQDEKARLTIGDGGSSTYGGSPSLFFNKSEGGTSIIHFNKAGANDAYIQHDVSEGLSFATGNSNRFYITAAGVSKFEGSLGVGRTASTYELEVSGTIHSTTSAAGANAGYFYATGNNSTGVEGQVNGTPTGTLYGINGVVASSVDTTATTGYGVFGNCAGNPVTQYGGYFQTAGTQATSTNAYGVYGNVEQGPTDNAYGGYFTASDASSGGTTAAYGVKGLATGNATTNYGGSFTGSGAATNYGVMGLTGASTGSAYAGNFNASGAVGGYSFGVHCDTTATGTSGNHYGIKAKSIVSAGGTRTNYGGWFEADGATTNVAVHVEGPLKVVDGTQGDGKVLTSDANGLATWEVAPGAGSGAALTGSTDNTICTVTGADAIQGEASLTFDGTSLGIGTAAPTRQLSVVTGATKLSNTNGVLFTKEYGSGSGAVLLGSDFNVGYIQGTNGNGDTANDLSLQTEGGLVGISTTDPQTNLHIYEAEGSVGDKDATITLGGYLTQGATVASYRPEGDSGSRGLMFSTRDASAGMVDAVTIDNSGNVGVGTNIPTERLELFEDTGNNDTETGIRISSYLVGGVLDDKYGLRLYTARDTSGVPYATIKAPKDELADLRFTTGSSDETRMVIDASGDVGIGGTPTYKLDVNGTFRTTGAATFDGSVTATTFTGNVSGSSGSCTGNAATVTNGVYTSNNLSVMAATTSAQLAGVISNETGSGSLVFATSPTLVTPALGTPASGVLTNCTALPAAQVAQGTMASGMVLVAPALGTPASGVLTNCTGTAASLTAGTVTTNANLTGDVTSSGNATTIATDAVDIAMLSATGTASSSTFLRGDNSWQAASGAVSAVANGADNRVATFSSSDALNGEANLTFDGTHLTLDGVDAEIKFAAYGGTNAISCTAGTGNLAFKTSDTERLRIDSYGQVSQPVETTTTASADSGGGNYDASYVIDFTKSNYQELLLDSDLNNELTLTVTGAAAGRTVKLFVRADPDDTGASLMTVTLPAWKEFGTDVSSPTATTFLLELTAWGTGVGDITSTAREMV